MPFESFIGNEPAVKRLRGLLRNGRLAHAYLFAGPEGVGKKLAAIEFARALGAEPRIVSIPEGRHEILIAQVHEVIRELSFASDRRRAVIFDDAHRMSDDAMNALLKTLEEPPAGTVMILVSSVPDRLLETVRSRCQTIFFFPLSDETIARRAREVFHLDDGKAALIAVLSNGSLGAAERLSREADEVMRDAREIQDHLLSREYNQLMENLRRIKDTEEARRTGRRWLELVAACLRDVLLTRFGRPLLLATDALRDRWNALDEEAILDRLQTIVDHQRLIDLNANIDLVVENALLRI